MSASYQRKVGFWISRSCYRIIRIFRLPRRANHWHWSARPAPPRGAFARSSRNVARVAMDAAASGGFARQAKRLQRTAKSCGPGAATVASIHAGPCWRGNGDNQRRSPGRARISRQTIARGKPGCLGCTCLIRVRLSTICTRCCGRSQRLAFPAPFLRRGTMRLQNSGKSCRGNAVGCLKN